MMLEMILGKIWPYLLGALAVVAGWVTARQSGEAAGRTQAKIDQLEANAKARKEARDVEAQTAAMADDDINRRLTSWVRGSKR